MLRSIAPRRFVVHSSFPPTLGSSDCCLALALRIAVQHGAAPHRGGSRAAASASELARVWSADAARWNAGVECVLPRLHALCACTPREDAPAARRTAESQRSTGRARALRCRIVHSVSGAAAFTAQMRDTCAQRMAQSRTAVHRTGGSTTRLPWSELSAHSQPHFCSPRDRCRGVRRAPLCPHASVLYIIDWLDSSAAFSAQSCE